MINLKIRNSISNIAFLRKLIFPLLRKFDFQISWTHDITNKKLFIKFWSHKGYWFFGKNRDNQEINLIKKLINAKECIIEVGAHIGYLTQIFENLVGDNGIVYAIEPTPDSRKFLQKNVSEKTKILPIVVSDQKKLVDFFIEDFGGFTNSIDYDFVYRTNQSNIQKLNKPITKIQVPSDTIDNICSENNIKPNFIKIDVEGAELSVLKGGEEVLPKLKALMVEISKNAKEVYELLYSKEFKALKSDGSFIKENNYPHGNIFFLKDNF